MEVKLEVAILVLLVFGLPVVFGDKSVCYRSIPFFFGNLTCIPAQSGQTCDSYSSNKSFLFFPSQMDSPKCCGIASHRNFPAPLDLTSADYFLYIFLDSLPVLILVPLILFFNINLASGPGHSLVFTFQVLVAVFHSAGMGILSYFYVAYPFPCGYIPSGYLFVLGPFVFFNEPLFFFRHHVTLTHYALGYVKILIAGVMVVLYLFLATCSQCPVQCCRSCWAKLRRSVRNWRERHLPQRPVFTGVCSVAILMYGSLIAVSFRLLFKCEFADAVCLQNDFFGHTPAICYWYEHTASSQPLCWGSPDHFPYFIPAWTFVGVAVLLSLPFFYHPGVPALVSYLTRGRVQLPRLHRVRPIFDLFQGVYKPRMQFFVGLHLLYRVAIWSAVAFASNDTKLYALICLCLVVLGIRSLFQPFESRRHNYLEGLLMVNVALVAVSLNITPLAQPTEGDNYFPNAFALIVTLILGNLPLFCVVVYYLYKFFRWCCGKMRRRSGYAEIQAQGDDEMEESYQGQRWEPPNNENFP